MAPSQDSLRPAAPHATRVTSATSVTSIYDLGYPRGHLGHLTEFEQEALDSFKKLLEERKYWTSGPPASHDDPTLLRYLRARRWVPEDAFKQFKETEDWRVANDIDVLYRTIELDAYDQSRRLVGLFSLFVTNYGRGLTTTVPTMDRPSRSTRHSPLHLRSQAPRQQDYLRVRKEGRQVHVQRSPNRRQDRARYAAPVRSV